jgi:Holliday junction resolvase RusA-like endonuclease
MTKEKKSFVDLWEPSAHALKFIEHYRSGIVLITVIKGLPPSANHAWIPRRGRYGSKIRSKEYQNYIDTNRRSLARDCLPSIEKSPLAICICFHSPRFVTKKNKASLTMDIDNRIKTLLDMLHGTGRADKGGVIPVDDALYWHIEAHKVPSEKLEFTEIAVANIPDKLVFKI